MLAIRYKAIPSAPSSRGNSLAVDALYGFQNVRTRDDSWDHAVLGFRLVIRDDTDSSNSPPTWSLSQIWDPMRRLYGLVNAIPHAPGSRKKQNPA